MRSNAGSRYATMRKEMHMKRMSWHTALTILVVFLSQACRLQAQERPAVPNASKTPRSTFSNTLEAQLQELKTNPLLERFRASREAKAHDPHRPIYHYVNPEGRLNDPNGLCFWQGRWHLFYQAYPPDDPRQHWGHAVSDDLVHWRDLPLAIYPHPEEKVYSGGTLVEKDRVIAMYHGTEVGNMVAVSSDPLLLNWEKVTGQAVIPFRKPNDPPLPYNIFDPCIWKKGDMYYSLSGGTLPGPGGRPEARRIAVPRGHLRAYSRRPRAAGSSSCRTC